MHRLFGILQECFFDIISFFFLFFAIAVDLLTDKYLQMSTNPNSLRYPAYFALSVQIRPKFKTLFDRYRKMFDQSISKSKDLGDMLRSLPGVVVQKHASVQGMADLYRIKLEFLERLVKSTIEPLKPSTYSCYVLDGYLSGFLAGPRPFPALLLRSTY